MLRVRRFHFSQMREAVPTRALLAGALLGCVFALAERPAAAQATADYAVQVTAAVQSAPPRITLSWPPFAAATQYVVYRKAWGTSAWGTAVATLAGSATGYADGAVAVGTAYEYQVRRTANVTGYGYLATGIALPLVEDRGKVILVVDATMTAALATELLRLQSDLAGDGWTVLRHDVSRTASVPSVKALVKADYSADPTRVKTVFLFGHVPVPYSGSLAPDGHSDHVGAWPADLYYGEMDGTWTDTLTLTGTGRGSNVPGDGKFDQSYAPGGTVELAVGRVDLANMPAFAPKTEVDLLRQYLNKDHGFRVKAWTLPARGLIDDNFGAFGGEAFASTGWRAFSAFFGPANVFALDWFGTLGGSGYLWAYGCGGGNYTGAGGVGSTSNFAATDTKTAFTFLFGSYFGDWDVSNNFLRAPLATTSYGLTCAWAGRPAWYVHHMAMGETIGYAARLSQNNSSTYFYGYGRVGARRAHGRSHAPDARRRARLERRRGRRRRNRDDHVGRLAGRGRWISRLPGALRRGPVHAPHDGSRHGDLVRRHGGARRFHDVSRPRREARDDAERLVLEREHRDRDDSDRDRTRPRPRSIRSRPAAPSTRGGPPVRAAGRPSERARRGFSSRRASAACR